MILFARADDREPPDELGLAFMGGGVPPLREAFRADLRQRLRATAAVQAAPARPRWGWRYALVAAALLLVVAGSSAQVAQAAAGDPLFDVKLGLEQVERAIAFDDEARVMVLAAQADRRHDELRRLLAEGSASVGSAMGLYTTAIARLTDAANALALRTASEEGDVALARARDAIARYSALLSPLPAESSPLAPDEPAEGEAAPASPPTAPSLVAPATVAPSPAAPSLAAPTLAVPSLAVPSLAIPAADEGVAPTPGASARPGATPAVPPEPPGPRATPALPPQHR